MNHTKECSICYSEFTAKRSDVLTCSDACRIAKSRNTFSDLHYAINGQYLEAKSKKKFILDLMAKAVSDKELRACLLTRSWRIRFRNNYSVQHIIRVVVAECYTSSGLRDVLMGKGVRNSNKMSLGLFLNAIRFDEDRIAGAITISHSKVSDIIEFEKHFADKAETLRKIEVVTYDQGWKTSDGKNIGNLANLKTLVKNGHNGVLILTNDAEASRFLRKEGFMVKRMAGKNTDEIIENYTMEIRK